MPNVVVRDAMPGDFEAICALNLTDVLSTSAMDLERLTALNGLSCYHRLASVDEQVAAFVLAMREYAPYRNENFEWFKRKFVRFVYIDRVVVASECRGRGLASLLYQDLFRHARENAVPIVTCEYNLVPPNEPSRRFHDRFGFQEQETQWVADGSKRVSLQAAVTA